MNSGKMFEQDFKKSVPEDVRYIRLKDDTSGFAGISNPCDCILYKMPLMYMLELKTHLGKSIPFGAISRNQFEGLRKSCEYSGIVAGVVFNFRDLEKTYFVDGSKVYQFFKEGKRKSFPVDWCRDNGIEIHAKKKVTRYVYDIEKFLGEIENEKTKTKTQLQGEA